MKGEGLFKNTMKLHVNHKFETFKLRGHKHTKEDAVERFFV